ncbi:MAG: ABC transporter substrate-binding protein, partial [Anaerolineales bacterium]
MIPFWEKLTSVMANSPPSIIRFISSLLGLLILGACAPLHIPATAAVTPSATILQTSSKPTITVAITPTSPIGIDSNELKGTEITLWQPWIGEREDVLRSMVEEFNHANDWGIQINVRTIGGIDELAREVQTVWASPDQPDLVIAYTFQAINWQKIKPLVVDWNAYVEDAFWGIPGTEQEKYLPPIWDSGVVKDFRWGIPARRDAQVMFQNQSWASELGFTSPPTTTIDFRKQACAAAKASLIDPQTKQPLSGGWILSQDYPTILGWINSFNGRIVDPQQDGYQFDTSEVRGAFRYLRQLYDDGCIYTLKDLNSYDGLATRKGLFVAASSGEYWDFEKAFNIAHNSDNWIVFPFPSEDGKAHLTVYGTDYLLLQSTPKKQMAGWLFVKWMLSKENQMHWSEKTLSLPMRSDVLEELKVNPQIPHKIAWLWDVIPGVVQQPALASWNTVRWMVADASRQLLAWYFTTDQMDTLL